MQGAGERTPMSGTRVGLTYAAALVLLACLAAMLIGGRGSAGDAAPPATRILAG
jgi:hypothetical protein